MTESDPQRQLAAALGRIPSGLFILTARQGDAQTGMLASWTQQCAFDPPHVTVAIKRGRDILTWLDTRAVFTLNILDDTQTDMIGHFGRGFALGEPAFAGLEVHPADQGGPILSEALGYLDCRVTARHLVGDHDLLIAQVVGGRMLNEGHPMVHIRKSGMHY
jgi:flavin reductase (DIM6/NTAB) family NADH-FMN oxidoreductase RutF